MAPITYESVPYDRARHEGFVRASWTRGARQPWSALAARLRRPDHRCLVAYSPHDPDALLGWACATGSSVVWAYTRAWPSTVRRRGLMTSLLIELGVDPSQTTPCLYWSPDAAAIAARGYRFVYTPQRMGANKHENRSHILAVA